MKTATRGGIFLPVLLLTLILMAVMQWVGQPLNNPAAPMGIISYELAGSVSSSQEILDSWDQAAKIRAGFSLGIDYLFMFAYAISIGLACLWAGETIRKRRWSLARLGIPLAWGVILAAGLDAIENLGLALMLFKAPLFPWPQIAALGALVKFSLVGLALLFAAYGGLAWLARGPEGRGSLPAGTERRQPP